MDDYEDSSERPNAHNNVHHKIQLEDDYMNISEYRNRALDVYKMLNTMGSDREEFEPEDQTDLTNNNIPKHTLHQSGEDKMYNITPPEVPEDITSGYYDDESTEEPYHFDTNSYRYADEYDTPPEDHELALSKEPSMDLDLSNEIAAMHLESDRITPTEETHSNNDYEEGIFTINPLQNSEYLQEEVSDEDSIGDIPAAMPPDDGHLPGTGEAVNNEAMAYTSYITPPENDFVTDSGERCRELIIQNGHTHPERYSPEVTEQHCSTDDYDEGHIVILQADDTSSIAEGEPNRPIIINGSATMVGPEDESGAMSDEVSCIQPIQEDPITTEPESEDFERRKKQSRTLTISEAPITAQPKKQDSTGPEAPCRTRAKRSARKKALPESMREIMIMPWSYDPCEDLDNLHTDHKALCCKSFCCPAWVFAENARKLEKNGCTWGFVYCFVPCIPGGLLRTRVREVRDIDGDPWDDCGLHWCCCCHCLSLVQESVELKAYEADPTGAKRAIPISRKKDKKHGTESSI